MNSVQEFLTFSEELLNNEKNDDSFVNFRKINKMGLTLTITSLKEDNRGRAFILCEIMKSITTAYKLTNNQLLILHNDSMSVMDDLGCSSEIFDELYPRDNGPQENSSDKRTIN